MLKPYSSLLILVGLLVACNNQVGVATQQPTKLTASPSPFVAPTVTSPPTAPICPTSDLGTSQSNTVGGTEIIVFIMDDETYMRVGIPRIHIWSDGRAMWTKYGDDDLNHVYETSLSNDEIMQVQRNLNESSFWVEKKGEGGVNPNVSVQTIWVKTDKQEKSLVVGSEDLNALVSSWQTILESSARKSEYFPKGACLFTRVERYDTGFPWPDNEISFDFSNATEGVFIDGEALSTIWNIFQVGEWGIRSNGVSYIFWIEIPEVSCNIEYDGVRYVCSTYLGKSTP